MIISNFTMNQKTVFFFFKDLSRFLKIVEITLNTGTKRKALVRRRKNSTTTTRNVTNKRDIKYVKRLLERLLLKVKSYSLKGCYLKLRLSLSLQ